MEHGEGFSTEKSSSHIHRFFPHAALCRGGLRLKAHTAFRHQRDLGVLLLVGWPAQHACTWERAVSTNRPKQ